METFFEKHSGELMILVLAAMVLGTLLLVVPQLLRSNHRWVEMQHTEHLKAMEQGQPLPPFDVRIALSRPGRRPGTDGLSLRRGNGDVLSRGLQIRLSLRRVGGRLGRRRHR